MADRRVRVVLEAQIAGFQQGMRQAQAELGAVAKNAGSSERQMAGMGSTIMGRVVPAIAGMVAGFGTFDKVVRGGFERLADLEDARKRMVQMGLSTQEVGNLMAGLTDTVTGTAFALNDGADILARFVSAGMPIDEVNQRLEMTADTAAFAQAPLTEIGDIFQRIQSEGRLTGETLNMLQVRGVPALDLLASSAGVSGQAMREMISEGTVNADRFFDLWEQGSKGFGESNIKIEGAAQSMGDTLRGALANAETAFARLGAKILEDFMPAIREGADATKDFADKGIAALEELDRFTEKTGLEKATEKIKDFNVTGAEFFEMLGESASKSNDVIAAFFEEVFGVENVSLMTLLADETEVVSDGMKTFSSAMSGAKSETEAFTMEVVEAADELAVLREEFDNYQSALKASTDPVLNLIDSLNQVDEAQRSYNEAISTYGADSPEAISASLALAEALVGADSAANNADLSFAGMNAVLDDYVAKGLLTEEAAEGIRGAIDTARGAAEDYTGPYVADLQAEIDDPAIRDARRQLDMVARTRNPKYLAELDRQAEIRARNKLNAVAAPRSTPITPYLTTTSLTVRVNYAISGGIPAGLTRGHDGGMLTASGVRRFHTGGMLPRFHGGGGLFGSMSGNEVPFIGLRGERVLSIPQTEALHRLLGLMGNTAMGGPSFHGGGVVGASSQLAASTSVRQLRKALDGMTLVLDDRRGQTVARIADLYGRGG